jgi:hypothetical protein
MTAWLRARLVAWGMNRVPDFVIGGEQRPYLLRHFVIPRNPLFNVYLHCFLRSDDDRAHHDHPWLFNMSWLLDGEYIEHTIARGGGSRPNAAARRRFQVPMGQGAAPRRVAHHRGLCREPAAERAADSMLDALHHRPACARVGLLLHGARLGALEAVHRGRRPRRDRRGVRRMNAPFFCRCEICRNSPTLRCAAAMWSVAI